MKRSLLIAICLLFVAGTVFAQAGSIGVFSFCDAFDCNFVDAGGLIQVYMVHVNTPGASASQFMLQTPPGWVHLGDIWNFPTIIGTSVTGVSIGYGGCYSSPICLGYANFLGAVSPPCTYFGIVPDPGALSGLIEAVDCAIPANKVFPTGGQGIVNNDGSCSCSVPVEETTWGQLKALYQ
jgi:hypothetical protein